MGTREFRAAYSAAKSDIVRQAVLTMNRSLSAAVDVVTSIMEEERMRGLFGKLENLYGDTTWVPVGSTVEAIRRWGSEKVLFGSDSPIDGRDTYLHNRTGDRSLYQEYFHEFKELVSAEDYDNVMYKNAQRLFGIRIGEKNE